MHVILIARRGYCRNSVPARQSRIPEPHIALTPYASRRVRNNLKIALTSSVTELSLVGYFRCDNLGFPT